MKRIAVMVSGGGTDLQSVINGVKSGQIPGEIAVVIASKPGVYALERAKKRNSQCCHLQKDYADEQAFLMPTSLRCKATRWRAWCWLAI